MVQHDEEAPHNEADQQFKEEIYEPAGGGWKTLLIIAVLLIGVGLVSILIADINRENEDADERVKPFG